MYDVVGYSDGYFGGGGGGHKNLCGEPHQCASDTFGSGFPNLCPIASVVMDFWSQVPCVYRVWYPCSTSVRFSCTRTLVPGKARCVQLK